MGRPNPYKGMTRDQIHAAALKRKAERDSKRGTRKATASRGGKKTAASPTRKAVGRIKVRQSTVDDLNRHSMAANIAKANSGKASPEFVEAAKRFYPGKIKSTGKKAPSLKKATTKKAAVKKAPAVKKTAQRKAPKFSGTTLKASANKKPKSSIKSRAGHLGRRKR